MVHLVFILKIGVGAGETASLVKFLSRKHETPDESLDPTYKSQVWWYCLVIPVLRNQRQEDS